MSDTENALFEIQRLDGARWCVKHEGFVDCDQDACDVARMDRLSDCEVWPLYVHRPTHEPEPVSALTLVRCQTCGGSGWDATHRVHRPTLDCDHIFCPLHGDVGGDQRHGRCLDCSDAWWVIHDVDLMHMLQRVSDGEDPDMVFAEHYANCDHEPRRGDA